MDNYFTHLKDKPLFRQKYMWAELNVKNQIKAIQNSILLARHISEFDVEVKGLVTSKEIKSCKEIQIANKNTVHEL